MRILAELLIDCEEDGTLRAVLVGMLREADRSGPPSPREMFLARLEVGLAEGTRPDACHGSIPSNSGTSTSV